MLKANRVAPRSAHFEGRVVKRYNFETITILHAYKITLDIAAMRGLST
jgi:hypothetical protein